MKKKIIDSYFLILFSLIPISIILGSGVSVANILLIDISFLIFLFFLKDFSFLKDDSIKFYNRIPDYSMDASDSGYYKFQFLSPAEYRILALDHSLSGLAIVPDNMLFGLHWEPLIRLNKPFEKSLLYPRFIIP